MIQCLIYFNYSKPIQTKLPRNSLNSSVESIRYLNLSQEQCMSYRHNFEEHGTKYSDL